jgi:hypothetical protein
MISTLAFVFVPRVDLQQVPRFAVSGRQQSPAHHADNLTRSRIRDKIAEVAGGQHMLTRVQIWCLLA